MKIKKFLTFLGWPLLTGPTIALWVGMFLNQLVIRANGGMMPVEQAQCSLIQDDDVIHNCASASTKFSFLEDNLPTSDGGGTVYSIGDIIREEASDIRPILAGLWLLLGIACFIRKEKFYLE